MKTVIIPSDYHPFVIEVNGIKYTYPEGTEQSVPDEVASAIEHYYKLQPKERPTDGGVLPYVSGENEGEVLTVKDGAWQNREAAKELPAVTSANNGKVLKVSSGKWAIGTDNGTTVTANPTLAGTEAALTGLQVGSTKYKIESGGGGNIFAMHVEYDDDAATVSVTETALEIATALENGAMLQLFWFGTGADYGFFQGVYVPYAYQTDGVNEGVAQDISIAFRDYPTDDYGYLEYNHLTQTWSVRGIVS